MTWVPRSSRGMTEFFYKNSVYFYFTKLLFILTSVFLLLADGEGLLIPMFVFTPWAPFACGSNPTRLRRLTGGSHPTTVT